MSAISRYLRAPVLNSGNKIGRSVITDIIRQRINDGSLPFDEVIMTEAQRLDIIAGTYYNEGRYWWIIAAASEIGWGMQVPPGTVIRIPDYSEVLRLIS